MKNADIKIVNIMANGRAVQSVKGFSVTITRTGATFTISDDPAGHKKRTT